MSIFKPMLATDADLSKLSFPLLASPKLDGIRAVVRDGVVFSRSNKPIPNKDVQVRFSGYDFFDGELIFKDPTSKTVYRDTTSCVMSNDASASDVKFFVFDHIQYPNEPYWNRYMRITDGVLGRNVEQLPQKFIPDIDALLHFESEMLELGYEGLILRSNSAPYKYGRSTMREGYLLKLKRFMDSEAVVIGFEERMHNGNEATTNELGRTARSSHKAGKTGRGDLGTLVLRNSEGVVFGCGTGFTDTERREIWANKDSYLGKIAKYKFFPVGQKLAPRHPVFLGWRDLKDIS